MRRQWLLTAALLACISANAASFLSSSSWVRRSRRYSTKHGRHEPSHRSRTTLSGRSKSDLWDLSATGSTDSKNEVTSRTKESNVEYFDFDNFWIKTSANYTACPTPDRTPDFKSKGRKGSRYWKFDEYVVRESNHWTGQHGIGQINRCWWTINVTHAKGEFVTGMCRFQDFTRGNRQRERRWTNNKKNKSNSRTQPQGNKGFK